ncbi:DUF6371 domain-containing protein [Zobellia barbeyronii]|uniref:DNA primase n=1 Tax=Zobellia barbeyronii TaxID=2748009 RepID=A0ABS5WN29_9FLAO|nr:DUF6371 domain-containing protein [Zobellia barbeyronii]MBT2163522.1 hypothetical protein [Zobellia barbeyronii]
MIKALENLCAPNVKKKRFVLYIDKFTGKYLPDIYGKCDRADGCNYKNCPYVMGYARMIWQREKGLHPDNWKRLKNSPVQKQIIKAEPTYIPQTVLNATLLGYDQNVFIQNLLTKTPYPFEAKDVEEVISLYHMDTVLEGYRKGAVTFPFIDENGRIRAVQVKVFDKNNHTIATDSIPSILEKRHVKNNIQIPQWLMDYKNNDIKFSCLFGADILKKFPNNPVILVEAPKTAVYFALCFGLPKGPRGLICLAVYNLTSLNLERCKVLEGRDVYLFPDLSKNGTAFDQWCKKAKEMQPKIKGTCFFVSDLLERFANVTDRKQGKDLADYLENLDWKKLRGDFRNQPPCNTATHKSKSMDDGKDRMTKEFKTTEIESDFVGQLVCVQDEYLNRRGTPRENYTQEQWLMQDDAVFFYEIRKQIKSYISEKLQKSNPDELKVKCGITVDLYNG